VQRSRLRLLSVQQVVQRRLLQVLTSKHQVLQRGPLEVLLVQRGGEATKAKLTEILQDPNHQEAQR